VPEKERKRGGGGRERERERERERTNTGSSPHCIAEDLSFVGRVGTLRKISQYVLDDIMHVNSLTPLQTNF